MIGSSFWHIQKFPRIHLFPTVSVGPRETNINNQSKAYADNEGPGRAACAAVAQADICLCCPLIRLYVIIDYFGNHRWRADTWWDWVEAQDDMTLRISNMPEIHIFAWRGPGYRCTNYVCNVLQQFKTDAADTQIQQLIVSKVSLKCLNFAHFRHQVTVIDTNGSSFRAEVSRPIHCIIISFVYVTTFTLSIRTARLEQTV